MKQSYKFVDTHAHLHAGEFAGDIVEVVKRAEDAGVACIICPGTDLETSRKSVDLADRFPIIYSAVGVHPHDASKAGASAMDQLDELSRHPKVVAIGEIGLDYHYDYSPQSTQKDIFERQIALAERRNLPVIIHSRAAEKDVIEILDSHIRKNDKWRSEYLHEASRYPSPKGVFHCFPGDSKMAWKVIEMGFYISLTGPVTYGGKPNKPNNMEEVAKNVSAEHILLETDSPYLAPAPYRGKRNEPSYVKFIAEKIASLQDLSVEDIARASTFGAHRLFGVGSYPEPAIAYKLRNSLYLNITIRCNADCVFCDRKGDAIIKGHNLRISSEPNAADVIESIGDPLNYNEIVFCGYGEPTIRLEIIKEVSRWIKSRGGKVRLNTDGHGSVINHRNIVPELTGLVDSVSISLNTTDPVQYGSLMQIDGKRFFSAMVEFAKECVKHNLDVTMTIVGIDEIDESKAREFVEKEVGAKFRKRPFF